MATIRLTMAEALVRLVPACLPLGERLANGIGHELESEHESYDCMTNTSMRL